MAGELAGKKILLVDDDRDIVAAMRAALEELGPEVYTALDGNEAVLQMETHSPDLIVLDQMLPKRSGFLVMEQLRKNHKPGESPRVIMITANLGSRHKVYAEALGVKAYLNKPFRMERLVESIRNLLG
jgi:DNA-binding response OmpR family regulator